MRMRKIFVFLILIVFVFLPSSSQAKKRVAILHFKNSTKEADLDYLSFGFGETLTTKLIKIEGLSVVSVIERLQVIKLLEGQRFLGVDVEHLWRQTKGVLKKQRTQSFSLFPDEERAIEGGKIAGASYVIIGNFRKIGSEIRVDCKLINVKLMKVKTVDGVVGSYNNLLNLQSRLTLKLAKSLGVKVTEDEKNKITQAETKSLPAYEWQARGMNYYEKFEFEQAIECFEKAINLDKDYAASYNYLGLSYDLRDREEEAIVVYKKAIDIYLRENDKQGLAVTYNELGNAYNNKGNYKEALEYYERSRGIRERLSDQSGEAEVYNNIGTIYDNKGDYNQALRYYQKALRLKKSFQDKAGMANIYHNLGIVYYNKGDYDKSWEYYRKSKLTVTITCENCPYRAGARRADLSLPWKFY